MHGRRHRAVIALALALLAAAGPAPPAEFVSVHVWRMDDANFGGFSGIEVSADGSRYWALSDRGTIRWGSILRGAGGRIRGLTMAGTARLKDSSGKPLASGWTGDAEGLAMADDGSFAVSFEGLHRIALYADPDARATRIASPEAFAGLGRNAGLEALARAPDGALLAIPEAPPAGAAALPVWRWRDGAWEQPFSLPFEPPWHPVGADVGPDGRLYLLERDFRGLGFASRVRRFALDGGEPGAGELLLETALGQFDNLEGIAVWDDGLDLRLTMVADDNFLFVQRTELVEYRLPRGVDSAASAQ